MKCLLISHGELANGMANTLKLFLGDDHGIHAISAFVNGVDVDVEIEKYMASIGNEPLMVFADILGGSVNNKMMKYIMRPNTQIFTGFNLPMILQASSFMQKDELTKDDIYSIISESQSAIVDVNDYFAQMQASEIDE